MMTSDSTHVTQRDLARLAGVSHATVSLALRGHRSIPPKTRERIARLAEKHGYRPDPALAALNAYRIGHASPRFHGTIAWLTCFSTPDGWRSMIQAEGYYHGAQDKARRLGYQFESIWAGEKHLTPRRLTQILLARGIRGLVIAPLPSAQGELPLEWNQFSSVVLGYSLARPQLHLVMSHQSRNMKNLVTRLTQLGYRRIGLAMPAATDERVDHNYLGGFVIGQQSLPKDAAQLSPLLSPGLDRAVFTQWYRQQKPDVVIAAASQVYATIEWLTELGLTVPADVGVAVASTPYGDNRISGINENVPMVGAMAVDTVVGMIHRNETGTPLHPWRILAEGVWFQGQTVLKLPGKPKMKPARSTK